jgi:thiosulfate/3-mercaptopyruvate sulfurtransferase
MSFLRGGFLRLQLILTSGCFLALSACQLKPTKVFETQDIKAKESLRVEKPSKSQIDLLTLIVDARPAFDYSISHLNGSIALRPEDFTQKEFPFFGQLETDRFALARYLARKGIAPDTPVVVVGRGKRGAGEEGRVAWTLKYLGVQNVQSASIEYFSIPLSSQEAPPRESEIIWRPEIQEDLAVDRSRVREILEEKRKNNPYWVILDVRSEDEYLGKDLKVLGKKSPEIGAINIPFQEFLDEDGFIKKEMKIRLEQIGVRPHQGILVLSNQGMRSAAVLMALRDLGFAKATHFPGGYLELMNFK